MFRDFGQLGKHVRQCAKIATLVPAAVLMSGPVKSDIMAECVFHERCVDGSCQATEEYFLRFRALKFEKDRTTLFVLGSPQLIDGHKVDPDDQKTFFDRQIADGVGNMSEFLDETDEMRFSLVGFRDPVIRQELFIQTTGPMDPSPNVLTVERARDGTSELVEHHGICDWVD